MGCLVAGDKQKELVMRTLLSSVSLLLFVGLALGFLFGCGGDDDPVDPGNGDECSLTLTAPVAASYYLTDDQCNIRWDAEGSAAEVSIELLKNGGLVGDIADTTANDGYYFWSADAMASKLPMEPYNVEAPMPMPLAGLGGAAVA